MRLILDEQQELLAKTARELLGGSTTLERVRHLRDTRDPVGFSRAVWKQMAELGWTGICLPEEYGGSGLGLADLCTVMEEAGRKLAPEPLVSTVLLGASAILLGGTASQKGEWLPRVAAGDAILAVGHQERGSHHDPTRVDAVAGRVENGFRLTGEKVHVLDGHVADVLIVSARGDDGVSLFLVDRAAKGVTITRQNRIDSRNAATVRLDRVDVPGEAVLGQAGQGRELLSRVLDRATVGLSAEMLGSASQAFDDTLLYLKSRKQFGVFIGSFQALQHRAARLFIELSLARSAVLAAARTADAEPAKLPRMASLAKARASDAFVHVANEAIQMHGGIGVTDEFHLGFYLKRARAADVTFGGATWHRRRWAELSGY